MLEADDGRVAGIEVKAASSAALGDFKHLRWLRDTIGDDFSAGIVLHTGCDATPVGDRLVALPIGALWSGDAWSRCWRLEPLPLPAHVWHPSPPAEY